VTGVDAWVPPVPAEAQAAVPLVVWLGRGDDDPWADGIDSRAALARRTASAITRNEFPRFAIWYA
jgi:hypothetical protein